MGETIAKLVGTGGTPTATTGVSTPGATPTGATPEKQGWASSPLAMLGIPLAAGVLSAASAPLARGVHGAAQVGSIMNRDPYGYRAIAAQSKGLAIQEAQANKQAADLIRKNPEQYGLTPETAKALPDKRLTELIGADVKPTFHNVPGVGLVRARGSTAETVVPEQVRPGQLMAKEVTQGRALLGIKTPLDQMTEEQNQASLNAYYNKETELANARKIQPYVNVNLPPPGTQPRGKPTDTKALGSVDADGVFQPFMIKDVKSGEMRPMTAADAKVTTGTTPGERETTKEEKDAEAIRKEARQRAKDTLDYGVLTVEEQQKRIADNIIKIKEERELEKTGFTTPTSTTQPQGLPEGAKDTGKTSGGKKVYQLPNGNYWTE